MEPRILKRANAHHPLRPRGIVMTPQIPTKGLEEDVILSILTIDTEGDVILLIHRTTTKEEILKDATKMK
jgi:hypothetical protein